MSRRGIYFESYSSFSGVFSAFSGAFGPNCHPFSGVFSPFSGILSRNFSPTPGVLSPTFSPFLGVFIFLRRLPGKGNAYCKRSFSNNQILGITKEINLFRDGLHSC